MGTRHMCRALYRALIEIQPAHENEPAVPGPPTPGPGLLQPAPAAEKTNELRISLTLPGLSDNFNNLVVLKRDDERLKEGEPTRREETEDHRG